MDRRRKETPPRPGMKWSRRHRRWVEPDTRGRERKAADRRILMEVERDAARIRAALRRMAEIHGRRTSPIEGTATAAAGELLGSLIGERRRSGLSQAEVARRMGVPQPTIVRLEAGTHSPTLTTLARYAAAIGVRFDVRRV